MIFNDLLTQIKTEARVKTDSEFDAVVIGLLNEMFKEATEAQRPFELRKEAELDIVAATGIVTLPADFFVHHTLEFLDVDTGRAYPLTDEDEAVPPAPRGMYGHPKAFEILSTARITLKPITSIVTGDKVRLVYYKFPPVVTVETLTTENPIPRLEPFLIRATVRRLRLLHIDDVQVAQMLSGDVASAASAYTKDEPVRNPRPNPSRG